MILKDILARELKAWPEGFGGYCISTIVEGVWAAWFNERRPAKHIQGGWSDVGCVELWLSEKPEDAEYAIVTRADWQAAVEALKAEQADELRPTERAVEWGGVGDPPVGAVVHTDHKRKEMTVKILAYGDHRKDKCVLVADMSHGREGKMFGWIAAQCVFRPIRTQEQIDAEEREKAINEMILLDQKGSLSRTHFCGLLYDANYRKQPK